MSLPQYPFIDVAVNERVRTHFAAGEGIVLFSADMRSALWANGSGAAIFGTPSIYDFLEQGPSRSDIGFRQVDATARQLARVGDRRMLSVRINRGFQRSVVQASCELIEIFGERAILFAAQPAEARTRPEDLAASMIDGFDDPDTFIAVIDGQGAVLGASDAFGGLNLSRPAIATLAGLVEADGDRLIKRSISTVKGNLPAAMGKIADAPALYLLCAVDTGEQAAEAVPGAVIGSGEAAADADINASVNVTAPVTTVDRDEAINAIADIEETPESQDEITLFDSDSQTAMSPKDAVSGDAASPETSAAPHPVGDEQPSVIDPGATSAAVELSDKGDDSTSEAPAAAMDRDAEQDCVSAARATDPVDHAEAISSDLAETTATLSAMTTSPRVADERRQDASSTNTIGHEAPEQPATPSTDGSMIRSAPAEITPADGEADISRDMPVNDAKALDEATETEAEADADDAIHAMPVAADPRPGSTTAAGSAQGRPDQTELEHAASGAAQATSETAQAGPAVADGFRFRADARTVRFVWKIDATGHFSEVSSEFGAAVGPRAANVVGMGFGDIATLFHLDPDGRIADLMAKRDTWSGKTVWWPVEGTSLTVPVDLAALPTYTRNRDFDGFRGFGIVRIADARPDPHGIGLTLIPAIHDEALPIDALSAEVDEAHRAAEAGIAEPVVADPMLPDEILEETIEHEVPQAISEAPNGERPALRLVGTPERRPSDKVIRFEEHRARLSPGEQAAFQEIGRRLEPVKEASAEAPQVQATTIPEAAPQSETNEADRIASAKSNVAATTETDGRQDDTRADTADLATEADVSVADADAIQDIEAPAEVAGAVSEDVAAAPGDKNSGSSANDATAADVLEIDATDAAEHGDGTMLTGDPTRDAEPLTPETRAADGEALKTSEIAASPAPHDNRAETVAAGDAEAVIETTAAASGSVDDTRDLAIMDGEPAAADSAPEGEPGKPKDDASALDAQGQAEVGSDGVGRGDDTTANETTPQTLAPTEAFSDRALPGSNEEHDGAEALSLSDLRAIMPIRERTGLSAEIVDQMPVALLVHAGDRLIHANPEFLKLTGYESLAALEEIGGLDGLLQRQDLDTAAGRSSGMAVVCANDEVLPVTARLQSVRWGEGSALMLALMPSGTETDAPAAGDAVAAMALRPSRTADQLASLQVEVGELRSILETATDGVVIIDADGHIRSMNRAASALFNYDGDEIEGKPFVTLFAHESQRAIVEYLSGLASHGVASVLNDGREVIGREASGGFLPLFMTIGRLTSSNGYCAVIRDITQWKRTEDELRTAKRAAETANAHKSEFLAHVSHEIRTPLNAIIGFADMMANERFGPIGHPRYIEYANDIGRSGRHVLDIVNDLLDISKIEAGEMDLDFESVGLNETVSEAVSLVQPQANGQRVIIRTALSQSVPPVVADLRSIKQIVLNLLSNAIRFTPSGGQIVVSTSYETNGSVVMRVRDTGIGMTRAELELAMKPFRQVAGTGRKRGDGTGLGLPLTKAMVDANRAAFAISSTPNEGTLVEITFPSQRVLAD